MQNRYFSSSFLSSQSKAALNNQTAAESGTLIIRSGWVGWLLAGPRLVQLHLCSAGVALTGHVTALCSADDLAADEASGRLIFSPPIPKTRSRHSAGRPGRKPSMEFGFGPLICLASLFPLTSRGGKPVVESSNAEGQALHLLAQTLANLIRASVSGAAQTELNEDVLSMFFSVLSSSSELEGVGVFPLSQPASRRQREPGGAE
ncbi:hypothetical protein SRHO_G00063360 [Serrasalmus rhombeus]